MSDPITNFPILKKTIAQLNTGTISLQSLIPASIEGVTKKVSVESILALGGGGSSTVGQFLPYKYQSDITPPPSSGKIKLNNTILASATQLYINMTNEDGYDIDLILQNLQINDIIYLQDRDDSSNFVKYIINNTPTGTHASNYHTVPIQHSSGSATFANNHNIFIYVFRFIHSPNLTDLGDVSISTPTNKQVLAFNSGTNLWYNYSLSYNDLTDLPSLFSGNYSDLSGKPTLGTASEKNVGTASGNVPVLDSSGLLDVSTIPTLYINKVTVGTQATRLTATGQNLGDTYKCTDSGISYMLQALPSSIDGNWTPISDTSPDWTQILNKPTFTSNRVLFGNGSTDADTSSNLIYSSGSLYIKNGGYLVGDADANTVDISYGRIRINGGTKVTGDAGASLKIKQTWNDATMRGFGFVTNITDTASDINSLVYAVNVNSIPIYQVRKDGAIALSVNSSTPWGNGVGAMISLTKPSTAPTTGITDTAILYFDDTDKKIKYIDESNTTHTIARASDINAGTVTSITLSTGTTGLTGGSTITSSGTWTLAGTLNIANGGTGQTTALLKGQALTSGSTLTANIGPYMANTSSGAFGTAPKMPNSPSLGDSFQIIDIGGAAQTNLITLDGNGKNFIGGDYPESSTFSIDMNYGKVNIIYNGTNYVATIM